MEDLRNILEDLSERAFRMRRPYFSDFLSRERAESVHARGVFRLIGGYDAAERVIAAALPEEDFPLDEEQVVSALSLEPNDGSTYSHRDYLGSILALGVKRESVGDIVINGSIAYVVATPPMAKFIRENLASVSRTGVKCKTVPLSAIAVSEKIPEEFCLSVSSMRLDCVLSAVFGLSRNDAKSLCERGACSVNREPAGKSEKLLKSGDLVVLKGWGRFRTGEDSGLSKKGKIRLNVTKDGK